MKLCLVSFLIASFIILDANSAHINDNDFTYKPTTPTASTTSQPPLYGTTSSSTSEKRFETIDECIETYNKNIPQNDAVEWLANTVTKTVEQFRTNFLNWVTFLKNEYLFPKYLDSVTIFDNYLISSSIFSPSPSTENHFQTRQIECEFNDNILTVRPFLANDITRKGQVYISKNYATELTVRGIFTISFTNPEFIYVVEQNSSLYHQWSSNQRKPDITYQKFDIELDIDPGYEFVGAPSIHEIKSLLKSQVTEQLNHFFTESKSFQTMYTMCMNPKHDQDIKYFEKYEYNHVINHGIVSSRNNISLKINSELINGSSHLKSIRINDDENFNNFSLLFDNLKAYVNLTYYLNDFDPVKSTNLKIEMDYLSIKGIIDNDRICNTETQFESSFVCLQSNDTVTSLPSSLLKKWSIMSFHIHKKIKLVPNKGTTSQSFYNEPTSEASYLRANTTYRPSEASYLRANTTYRPY